MENFADPEVGCASGELMLGDPRQGEAPREWGCIGESKRRCGAGVGIGFGGGRDGSALCSAA